MAAIPPPSSSVPPPHADASAPLTPLSWEGEKMFNIYIYDYCYKRGFRKTARELMAEADISTDPKPPINARQGLLFEWWSVFWVLFQAKSNGGGSEDALLYTQHQQQHQPRNPRAPGTLPPGGMAGQLSQPPVQRPNQLSSGMMNGIGTLQGQHQLPPGSSPMSFAIGGGPATQTNGIAAPHPPTPGSAPNQHQQHPHASHSPNFNPIMQGQRPPSMNGPPQPQPQNGQQQPQQQQHQQRPIGTPNHNLPFASPTMGHSPNIQHTGPHPSGQQPPGPGPQPSSMGNHNGPSPLMNRASMMPPNAMHPGMVMPGGPQQPPQVGQPGVPQGQGFGQMSTGRPPSRTNTPQMQQPGMMHQSPSMASRPVMMQQQGATDYTVNNEFLRLQHAHIHQAKMDIGMPLDKDPASFSMQDKRKILDYCVRRFPKGPTTPGGPSTSMMQPPNMQRPPQQQQLQQMQQQQHQQHQQQLQHQQQMQMQQQQQRIGKRSSTSPGEEPDHLSADSSPPERKRPRRSPMDNAAMLPKGNTPTPYPQTPQQMPAVPPQGQPMGHPPQGPPGHLPQQPPPTGMPPQLMMMQRNMGNQGGQMQQMGLNGHIPPPGMGMQGQQGPPPQGQQGMGGMQGQMAPHGHMGPPIGMVLQGQMGGNYRIPLHQVHNAPGGPNQGGLPQGGQQPFNPGMPNNQKPSQGRPGMVPPPPGAVGVPGNMMPPPPSPANAAAPLKDQKDVKPILDGSPRGQAQMNQIGGPMQQHQQQQSQMQQQQPPQGPGNPHQIPHPGTPGPQGQQQPQQVGNPQGGGPQQQPMATSPPGNLGGGLIGDPMLFSTDFSDFDPGLFSAGDTNLDFERDFGSWFNGEDGMNPGLDMK